MNTRFQIDTLQWIIMKSNLKERFVSYAFSRTLFLVSRLGYLFIYFNHVKLIITRSYNKKHFCTSNPSLHLNIRSIRLCFAFSGFIAKTSPKKNFDVCGITQRRRWDITNTNVNNIYHSKDGGPNFDSCNHITKKIQSKSLKLIDIIYFFWVYAA